MDYVYRAVHIATHNYDNIYRPAKSDRKLHENSSLAKTFELLTLLFTLYFQRLAVDYSTFGPLLGKRIYVHLSLTISQFAFFAASIGLKGAKNGGQIFKTVCWVELFISSFVLAYLGKPLQGFLIFITPLLSTLALFRFFIYSTTNPQPLSKQDDQTPPEVTGTQEFHFSEKKEIDVPLFLKEVERFPNQTQVTVDFSYSSFDDQSLPLTLCRLFSAQSSDLYEHEILLYHCTQVTEKGIRKLLRLFPRLTLHLSGTSLTPVEVYHLQSEFREATLLFHSGIQAQASQSDCRLCFNGNSIPFFKKLLIEEFPYFKALLESGMKESNEQELDLTTIIRFEPAIQIFIRYLTTGSFPEMPYEEAKGSVEFLATLLGDSPDFMRVLDLGIARKAFFITDQNDPLLAWRELLDCANSGLLISRNAFIHYFKRQFGIGFGFDSEDKLVELTIHDVEPLSHALLTKIEEALEEVSPSLTVILDLSSSLYANKKRVFDFLQNEGIKKVHLTGTFWDLQEMTRRGVEKKLTKLELLGEGEIDLGEVRKCTELSELSYAFSREIPIHSFFTLKKLEKITVRSTFRDLHNLTDIFPFLNETSSVIPINQFDPKKLGEWEVKSLMHNLDSYIIDLTRNQNAKQFIFSCFTNANEYLPFLPKNPYKEIIFSFCPMNEEVFETLKQRADQLSSLGLLQCKNVPPNALQPLLASCKELIDLSLDDLDLQEEGFKVVFNDPLTIEKLSLAGCKITLETVLFVLEKCPCLQEIDLMEVDVDITEIRKLYPKLAILKK